MQPPQGKKRDKKSCGVETPYKIPKTPKKNKNKPAEGGFDGLYKRNRHVIREVMKERFGCVQVSNRKGCARLPPRVATPKLFAS